MSTILGNSIISGGGKPRNSGDLIVNGPTVRVPAGTYRTEASATIASGNYGTISASKSVSGNTATVTPQIAKGVAGYNNMDAKSGNPVTVAAEEVCNSGQLNVQEAGTYNCVGYSSVKIDESVGGLNIDYGLTPPSDTSKLWIPLEQKPVNVEVNGEYMQFGDNYMDNEWESTMTVPLMSSSSVTIGDKIYTIGWRQDSFDSNIYCYNTSNNTFKKKASLGTTANWSGYILMVAYGTKIYFFGTEYACTTIQEYNTETNTVVTKQATINSYAARYACGIAYNNGIYIIGGISASSGSNYHKAIDFYDVENDKMINNVAPLPSPRLCSCAMLYNGLIYIVGGGSYDYYTGDGAIYTFNPITKEVTRLATKLKEEYGSSIFSVVGNRVYSFGGIASSYQTLYAFNTIQVFDAATNSTFILQDTLPQVLCRGSAGVVGDNIYILGGSTSGESGKPTDKIRKFVIQTQLQHNHLKIFTDMYSKQVALINTNNLKLYSTVRSSYIGKPDNYAKLADTYVYNLADANWKTLDGTPYTT